MFHAQYIWTRSYIAFVSLKDYKSDQVVRMIHPILGKNLFLPRLGANREQECSMVRAWSIHIYANMTYALPLFTHFVWHKHITKDMKQPFVKPWPANRPLAASYTYRQPQLMRLLVHTIHLLDLSSCTHVYTTHPEASNEHICIQCPLMSSRQASKQATSCPCLLPLIKPIDRAIYLLHHAHNSTHTRTPQCLPVLLLR